MSTESQTFINHKKRLREDEVKICFHNKTAFGPRVRYTRVKDVGTRITSVEQRNKRIIEVAKPLPDNNLLSGRAVYWFVTAEDVEVMFQDESLFVWQERVIVPAEDSNYFLNQINFQRNKKGLIALGFPDGGIETIMCYSTSTPMASKRVKLHSSSAMSVVDDGVSALLIDDESQSTHYSRECNSSNINAQPEVAITTVSTPNIFNLNSNPIDEMQHIQHCVQQEPQILSNSIQVSANKPVVINILLLVPDKNEYIQMSERALLEIGFVKEVSSENQQHLYSEKDLVKKQRHVLLFPYGKKDRYSKIEDRLPFASEVILLIEKREQQSSLMAITRVTNVKNSNMNIRQFIVKTETIPTTEVNYLDLTLSAQQLFVIDELHLPILGGISCNHEANLTDYFIEWNLGPTAGHAAQNIFICFKYEPKKIKTFTEYAAITLKALGIDFELQEALVINGSVLVIIQCPAYIPWYIMQHSEDIFQKLKEEHLTEIYEWFLSDIDASAEHPENKVFFDELTYFKELMISDGAATQETHKRFRMNFRRTISRPIIRQRLSSNLTKDVLSKTKDRKSKHKVGWRSQAPGLRMQGEALRRDGDYEGALEDFNASDQFEPDNALTLCGRGDTKRLLDDFKGALEDLNRAHEIDPNNGFILCVRGETKRLLVDYQGALEDLNRANTMQPNEAFPLRSRGATKRLLGDLRGALEDLNRADEIQPNDAFTLSVRGEIKLMLGDAKGALKDLNRANRFEPEDAFTLSTRGATKRILHDYEGALQDLNRANEAEPDDALTLYHRTMVRYHLKDFAGALDDITLVLTKCPTDELFLAWKNGIQVKMERTKLSHNVTL